MSAALSSSLYISPKKPSCPQQPLSTKPTTIKTTLHTHPLFTVADQAVTLQMKEKILCLELMGIDSGKALSLNPFLRSASLDSVESVLNFLQSKGIYPNDLPRILGMCPKILTSDIRTELNPVFMFLSSDLHVPDNAFRRVVKKCPRLLISSVEDQLKPALFYLQRLGFKDIDALAYQDPVLLVSSVEHTLIPKLRFLESIGFTRSEAIGMILRCPALFTFSIENNFKPKFDYFMCEIKGKLENLKEFPQYFAFSLEKRIKPRHLESMERGLELPLPLMLKSTDEEFEQLLLQTKNSSSGYVCRGTSYALASPGFGSFRHQLYHQSSSVVEEELDPFSLVADELSLLSNKLRAMVVAEVPKLASAAEYFFKRGVEGKQFRPTILLLMATALNVRVPEALAAESADIVPSELRVRQRGIAEITEMIHVASLLHDDVLDDADTRRGVGSLNFVMGNKISVLAGDFLLSRACVALAALKNTEVVSLLATVVEHLVTGETMQMTSTTDQRHSMDYYMQKTYYKTASLISNSCKAIALLAGQSAEVAMLAFEYGRNLGLAFQLIDDVLDFTGTSASLGKGSLSDIRHGIITAPILFAMEEFPQLRTVVDQLEKDPTNVDIALEYLGKSKGIQRTRELAIEHANRAAAAIGSLPETDDEDVKRSRRALIDLTHRVISRNK
ncbi:unnamed protein product [Brassica rapa]|uniref:Uncharacterized protein n=1 Tax=Brassica campestris TaxID=3711 RepID=A0A3P5Z346_BRACM|nr:unnamed protein product [Brassica rapa]VDC70334.1 unnamed protein product [Brassica rapa]